MSDARNDILNSVRNALANVPDTEKPEDLEVPRKYRVQGDLSGAEIVSLFAERVGEYKARVQRVGAGEIKQVIAESCRREKVENLVVPEGFDMEWLPDSVSPLVDRLESPLSHIELDGSDGVITGSALAVADTGTIFLDSGKGQGRRALTLLPDYHICIVREDRIVELIPEGFAHFQSSVKKEGLPITLISGPSATSDIELNRVEGVHGPRRLEVLIVRST